MCRAPLFTLSTIGLLFAGVWCAADERSVSSRQRYRVQVPSQVAFGRVSSSTASEQADPTTTEDADPLVFMAETTSALTIQFETDPDRSAKLPLRLTVDGVQMKSSMRESIAHANGSQASMLAPGRTMLHIDVGKRPAQADATVTTIVVTIVAQ